MFPEKSLLKPLVADCMVEQNAHEVANLLLWSRKQAELRTSQLSQPALNAHSSNIPKIHIGPMWTYPLLEELTVNNPRRVRVPIGICESSVSI
jgi:hypothetical protein